MSRERTARVEKQSGSYFFWDAWRGSEIGRCTYDAKGLWMDILAVMSSENPRGVIAGDLEALADALGFGAMTELWATQNARFVSELERKNVFSRGGEIDEELPPNAIVNRRMYREYCKEVELSEERRRAANIRWDGRENKAANNTTMDEIKAELACKTCKVDAKQETVDASQVVESEGVAVGRAPTVECKTMLSPTQTNPTQPTQTKALHAVTAGEVHGESATRPLVGKDIFDRLIAFTRDRGPRAKWWNVVVNAFRKAGQLSALDEHCQSVEGERGNGIKAPTRYMSKRVFASARELGIVVPDLPKGDMGASGC